MNVILFGKKKNLGRCKLRVLKGDHPRLSGWNLNPMTSVLIREDERDREKISLLEDRGKNWCYAATSQGVSEANRSWKRQGNILL